MWKPSLGFIVPVISLGTLMFLVLPVIIVVPMSFSGAQSLEFPPPSLSFQWYRALIETDIWIEAGTNSVILAFASSTLALVIGTMGAYVLARGRFRFRTTLETNIIAPMIVPQIITAVALYIFFARIGLLGTFPGLILGHTVLVTPYVVLIMQSAIQAFDHRIEQVAMTLGAGRLTILTKITLPNIAPSAAAAWIFSFVLSFDEVVITVFVSGPNLTIPKRMFNELMIQVNPTITAVATLLIAFNLLTLGLLIWLSRTRGLTIGGFGDKQ